MTEDTIVAAPPPASPPPGKPRRTFGDNVRFVVRGVGQTLITLGLVVLLFVVYEVWITNIFAHRAQQKVTNELHQKWEDGIDPLALPGGEVATIPVGDGIAVMYVPRLGRDFHFTIVEGGSVPNDSELEKGPAHYGDTQLPGEVGNFAVAGHRVGKGEPFLNIDKLRAGDAVIIETKSHWYVYRVLGERPDWGKNPEDVKQEVATSSTGAPIYLPGREIVDPGAGRVLFPVPDNDGVTATKALMTMTTCHPKFTASHRMIVYSALDASLTVDLGKHNENFDMPDSVQALYAEVKA
jgi:sortase A